MPTVVKKILIIGDLHFKQDRGYADYIDDRRIAEQDEILKSIIKEAQDCQKIVFMGDNFNSKNNPSSVVKQFTNFVESFHDKELFILAGNHEKFGDGRSAIDYLNEIINPNWHVITDKIYTQDGLVFCPYFFKSELQVKDDKDGTKKIMKMLPTEDKVLFAHHTISDTLTDTGASTNIFNEIVLPKKKLEERYKMVIAGHIHKPQISGRTIITGGVFNDEVGEDGKYIWKLNEKTLEVNQIKLPGRSIFKFENPSFKDLDKIEKSNIVKVVLTDKKLTPKLEEYREHLEKFDAHLLLEVYPHEKRGIRYESGMLEFSIKELLGIYAKEKKIDVQKLESALELIDT